MPTRIAEHTWPETARPLVSICCITYNQERFVRDCLEGFLMQETTFPVELLIHDDASTDNTANIIREYEARHPHIIRAMYQTENQYARVKHPDVVFNFPRARGRYIALCEGDDYWTAPDKLQMQVDFMEAHPAYSGCFHNVKVVYEDGRERPQYAMPLKDTLTLRDLAEINYISTPSALFRARLFPQFPDWYRHVPVGDWPLHVLNAEYGDVGYLNRICAVYRVHAKGVWSSLSESERYVKTIRVAEAIDAHLRFKHTRAIRRTTAYCHYQIAVNMRLEGNGEGIFQHLWSAISESPFHERIPKKHIAAMLVKHAASVLVADIDQLNRWLSRQHAARR